MQPIRYNPSRRQTLNAATALVASLAAAAPRTARAADEPTTAPAAPPGPPVPAEALPVVDARFPAEVAPGVFVLPDKRIPLVPNVGIVVGRDTALVVDCGLGLESGENVLKAARALAPGRRLVLTVTHNHPEHGFGAQVFKPDARIYYNRAQAEHFARTGPALLDGFRAGVLPPHYKHLLDGVALTPPDETYDGARATLDLGGRTVEFRTWGTAHSPGDQAVYLPEVKVLFVGDLLEERMFPIVPLFPPMIESADIDVGRWETALDDVRRLGPTLIVPGHGNLAGPELVTDVLGYFKEVRALVAAAGGVDDGLEARVRARYPTWENPRFIGPALRYFAREGA